MAFAWESQFANKQLLNREHTKSPAVAKLFHGPIETLADLAHR